MKTIGLIGGVASGKSFVARCFEELGAVVVDGDAAGHEVLREEEIEAAARDRWGADIFDPEGHIDRGRLAEIVFGDDDESIAELRFLEELTHPRIREALGSRLKRLAGAGEHQIAILDAAVLLKAGWDDLCDKLVLVEAPRDVRLERVLRRGWGEKTFTEREASQRPLEIKKMAADWQIDNSGDDPQTQRQVRELWDLLSRTGRDS